jgi:Inner membrane component of T3SS, cytoplasmic domain/Domain of unknown function (DUF1707)
MARLAGDSEAAPSWPGRLPGIVRPPGIERPQLRASDAERDRAVGELRERFAEGRLSQDSFLYRVDAALRARARDDLSALLADLPPAPPRERLRDRLAAATRRARRRVTALLPLPEPQPLMLPREARARFTIGRDLGCDLVLGDRTVSRYHASLDRSEDGWLLGELGSTNGTLLNGWRIASPVAVRPGDRVSFGALTFIVSDRT